MSLLRGYLHTYEEAYLLVHTVRLGFLKPISRRLSLKERGEIKSGSIFIFIRDLKGIIRWTDGKLWSSSKISGSFLLYKEESERFLQKAERGVHLTSSRSDRNALIEKQVKSDKFALFKKTISIRHEKNIYHIISYFQPIFDKWSISTFPFFQILKNSVSVNTKMNLDVYLENLKKRGLDLISIFELLPFKYAFLRPNIDRMILERIACDLLKNKMYMVKNTTSHYE